MQPVDYTAEFDRINKELAELMRRFDDHQQQSDQLRELLLRDQSS